MGNGANFYWYLRKCDRILKAGSVQYFALFLWVNIKSVCYEWSFFKFKLVIQEHVLSFGPICFIKLGFF